MRPGLFLFFYNAISYISPPALIPDNALKGAFYCYKRKKLRRKRCATIKEVTVSAKDKLAVLIHSTNDT